MNDFAPPDELEALAVNLRPVDAPLPPGLVAVTADEAGRYSRFAICMQGLEMPAGCRCIWQVSNDIPGNRNGAVENLLEAEGLEWVWFIDDDHAFRPDILLALLARNVDVVTPICLRRQQPFLPIPAVDDDFMDLTRYGEDELVEVQHAGSSGMLIRRRVLEAVPAPWFELGRDEQGRRISEDVAFCRLAQAAGYSIHVDLAVRLGHITTAVVWPVWSADEERWLTGYTIADGAQLATEPASLAAGVPG